ncbi:MAG: TIGR02679 domain-containing protein [Candidatus Desulforudaceae bacterium]|nr:TIGR02679 domain-containing protein [Eubacteriales bacterium]
MRCQSGQDTEHQVQLKGAVHYFRDNRGFHRLFNLMIKKYKGLGRVGGSVTLKNPTDQEREALSLFLGRDLTGRMSVTVSLETFTEALNQTKYSGIGFNELLDEYVGRDVLTRVEEQEVYRSRKALFFRELATKHDSEYGRLWLEHIQSSGPGTRGIHLAFDTVDDYDGCVFEVTLSESRLKGLDTVNHPLLVSVRDRIRSVRKAGYQEGLVGSLVDDIKKCFTYSCPSN